MLCREPFERGAHTLRDIDFTGAPRTHDLEAHDRRPSRSAIDRCSATVSDTVATWSSRTRRPSLSVTSSVASLVGRLHGRNRTHGEFGATEIGAAARVVLLHLAQLAGDVGRTRVQREQARRIESDADLTGDAADTRDRSDARDREQRPADLVVDEP